MSGIDLEGIRRQSVESLLKCADNAIKYLDDESRNRELENLKAILLEYCTLDLQNKVSKESLSIAEKSVTLSNVNDLDKHFAENMKKMMARLPDPSRHDYMNEFNMKITTMSKQQRAQNLDNSDIVATNASQQYIDPISKKPIVNPVRNKLCGHIYEADSIKNLLKMNPKLKCPVAGCGDRTHIQMSNLVPDEDLKLRLTQQSTVDPNFENTFYDLDDSQS